ncbi:MAG: type II secretion system protein GspK [Pseudomonadota bacterium]
MSLLNVLVVVAASAGLVQVMLTGQERALDRLSDTQDLVQARSLAEAGVTSVAVALRRDLVEAPESDHAGETWMQAAQDPIQFDFGTFAVTAEDLRGRLDLNALGPARLAELRVFASLLAQLDLPETLAAEIARAIAADGPIAALRDLERTGLSQEDLARLAPHVTALPTRYPVNLNAATEPLLAALFSNPAAARSLIARRKARGMLDRSDLAAFGLALPPLAGFTSDAFAVTASAAVGDSHSTLVRHILRDVETGEIVILPGY